MWTESKVTTLNVEIGAQPHTNKQTEENKKRVHFVSTSS